MNFFDTPVSLNGILSLKACPSHLTLPEAIEFSQAMTKKHKSFGFSYKGKNVITQNGIRITARSIATGSPIIRAIAFGTGGAASTDLLSPLPPNILDTSLTTEAFRVEIDSSSIVFKETTPVSVTFAVLAAAIDYSGLGIEFVNEAGLVTATTVGQADLDLFSRITFPSVPFASLASPSSSVLAEYEIFIDANSASLFNSTT